MANEYGVQRKERFGFGHFLIRLIVGTVVLGITAALTPGFAINGTIPLIMGALVLALLDWAALKVTGISATPFGRGISGFILAVAVIYFAQFFVPGYYVTFWGAVIGSLFYGIVDAVIPGKAM